MNKILVIEDSTLMRSNIIDVLHKIGFDNVEGLDCGEKLLENPDRYLNDVNLVLCDIRLPGISGIDIAKNLHDHQDYSHIPIVFLTSHNEYDIVNEAIKAGAADYITKPIKKDVLEVRISRILGVPVKNNEKDNLNYTSKDLVKTEIDMEYQRSIRGKQPTSCLSFKVEEKALQKCADIANSLLRKIDKVYNVENQQILIIMPLTGKEGLDVVKDKIFGKFSEENFKVIEEYHTTFDHQSDLPVEDLFEELKLS